MRDGHERGKQTDGEASGSPGLLSRVRARTESELGQATSAGGAAYSAAALGQAPYVAMGNGVIVVQRKCAPWNC